MLEIDAKRIGELFLQEVGTNDQEVCLENFLRIASKKYKEMLTTEAVLELSKTFYFEGVRGKSRLSLRLNQLQDSPDLTGIGISGETRELETFMKFAYGNLKAEFRGLPLEEANLEKKILKSHGNYIGGDKLQIYLMTLPDSKRVIKKVEMQKDNVLFHRREQIDAKQTYAENLALLSKAGRIVIENHGYIGNDPTKELVNEEMLVIQPSVGVYFFNYQLQTATNYGLSVSTLPALKNIFALIEKGFIKQSLVKMKVEPRGTL